MPGSAQVNRTFLHEQCVRRVPLCRMSSHTVKFVLVLFLLVCLFALPLFLRSHCLRAKLASFGLLSTDLLVCFIWPDAAAAAAAQCGNSPTEDEPKHRFRRSRRPPPGRDAQFSRQRVGERRCTRWHDVSQEESMIFDQDGTTGQVSHLRR